MTLIKLTKKQIVCRIVILAVLLLIGFVVLVIKASPTWKPAALNVVSTNHLRQPNPYLNPDGMTQESRILPPEGFTRTDASPDSLASFLRSYAVYPDGTEIPVFDGTTLNPSLAAAIFDIPIGAEGYQQCADSIIRLYTEYFYQTGQRDKIAFHLSNGFLCDYDAWCRGKRVLALGEFSCWIPALPAKDTTQTLNNYLVTIMRYAGTLSLTDESHTIPASDAHIGDFLCRGGTPGHVILITDEAVNEQGERCFLLGQGYIPSQSFHIIAGTAEDGNPWYTEEQLAAETIAVSGNHFKPENLRRWNDGFSQ